MLGMCKKFCGKEECAECYEKSFASVEKSKLWCYEHNPEKPYEILKGSHTFSKAFF
jgi:hypothetical protein